jgi:hypothetical protein
MMPRIEELGSAYLRLYLSGALLFRLIQAEKYRELRPEAAPALGDHLLLAALPLALLAPAAASGALSAAGLLLGAALFSALWLDAVLFRLFTIELGPDGIGGVVFSELYREVAGLSLARRFFSSRGLFALLPAAALSAHLAPLLPDGSAAGTALSLSLIAYFGAALLEAPRRSWLDGLLLSALAASGLIGAAPLAPALPAALAGWWLSSPRVMPATGLWYFFRPRPLPRRRGFVPRPEHAPLLAARPRPPGKSPLFGRLRGADVILLTFESLGRDHLAAFSGPGRGASAPLLEGLLSRATYSLHHSCVSPTTNNAHLALYSGGYTAQGDFGTRALVAAGYRAVYLSAAETSHYGLRGLLDAAGFTDVIDAGALAPEGGGKPSDYGLLSPGLDRVAALGGGRFFLHVHAINTHTPYRVVDGARFRRHDSRDDYGRFLNGIEEADWIFAALLKGLSERGLAREPLLVITSDHGQAFGELGYRSHGSAVIKEELAVPFLLHHPALPAGAIPFSSHLDVLPTILDLLGVEERPAGFGGSIFSGGREPGLFVWAGCPSRGAATNFGLIDRDKKYMLDLITERLLEMGWDDAAPRELAGPEREYFAALLSELLCRRGLA